MRPGAISIDLFSWAEQLVAFRLEQDATQRCASLMKRLTVSAELRSFATVTVEMLSRFPWLISSAVRHDLHLDASVDVGVSNFVKFGYRQPQDKFADTVTIWPA